MRYCKLIIVCVLCTVVAVSTFSYAEILALGKLLKDLDNPRLTSLQRLERVKDLENQRVSGAGKVRDIITSYGSADEALVYIEKPSRGKTFEIVLVAKRADAEKVDRGRTIRFEGTFVSLVYHTFTFREVSLKKSSRALFSY